MSVTEFLCVIFCIKNRKIGILNLKFSRVFVTHDRLSMGCAFFKCMLCTRGYYENSQLIFEKLLMNTLRTYFVKSEAYAIIERHLTIT